MILKAERSSGVKDYAETICTVQDTQTADSFQFVKIHALAWKTPKSPGDGHLMNADKETTSISPVPSWTVEDGPKSRLSVGFN